MSSQVGVNFCLDSILYNHRFIRCLFELLFETSVHFIVNNQDKYFNVTK